MCKTYTLRKYIHSSCRLPPWDFFSGSEFFIVAIFLRKKIIADSILFLVIIINQWGQPQHPVSFELTYRFGLASPDGSFYRHEEHSHSCWSPAFFLLTTSLGVDRGLTGHSLHHPSASMQLLCSCINYKNSSMFFMWFLTAFSNFMNEPHEVEQHS